MSAVEWGQRGRERERENQTAGAESTGATEWRPGGESCEREEIGWIGERKGRA